MVLDVAAGRVYFVNTSADEINRIAKYCNFDRIQLSGDEPWEFVKKLNRPTIVSTFMWLVYEHNIGLKYYSTQYRIL